MIARAIELRRQAIWVALVFVVSFVSSAVAVVAAEPKPNLKPVEKKDVLPRTAPKASPGSGVKPEVRLGPGVVVGPKPDPKNPGKDVVITPGATTPGPTQPGKLPGTSPGVTVTIPIKP